MIPAVIAGIIGISLGAHFGDRFSKRINRSVMEKLVYLMVAFTGIRTLVTL